MEETKKARAFARFARTHRASPGMTIEDTFYDQACMALGICNHSTWMRLDPNDNRWDDIFIASNPTPWHIENGTIRDANGGIVVSTTSPCNMNTRRLIVRAVNKLATPERNCDRFGGDRDKLIEACMRERGLRVTDNFIEVFCAWLLETATEKGGAE